MTNEKNKEKQAAQAEQAVKAEQEKQTEQAVQTEQTEQILNEQFDKDEQKSGHFPIFLEIKDQSCLVVGSGEAAVEKAEVLLKFGAKVTVLAEETNDILKELSQADNAVVKVKDFEASDIADCRMVIVAEPSHAKAAEIAECCRGKGVLVTVIDDFEKGDFIFPYFFRNGCITTAVSSGGKNPALARSTKNMFEAYTPDYYEVLSESISKYNDSLKHKIKDSKITKKIYDELFNIGKANKGIITEEHIQELIKYYTK